MLRAKRIFAAAVLAATLLAGGPAAAIERQHHIGIAADLAILKIDDKSTLSTGGGGTLYYAYGLTDQWNFTLELGSAVVAAKQRPDFLDSPHTRPAQVSQATAGVSYVIDILQWVPYLGAEAGGYLLTGGTLDSALVLPGVAVTLGLDYQITRHIAVGLGGREHFMVTKLSTYPSFTTVLLRWEYMWGY